MSLLPAKYSGLATQVRKSVGSMDDSTFIQFLDEVLHARETAVLANSRVTDSVVSSVASLDYLQRLADLRNEISKLR